MNNTILIVTLLLLLIIVIVISLPLNNNNIKHTKTNIIELKVSTSPFIYSKTNNDFSSLASSSLTSSSSTTKAGKDNIIVL